MHKIYEELKKQNTILIEENSRLRSKIEKIKNDLEDLERNINLEIVENRNPIEPTHTNIVDMYNDIYKVLESHDNVTVIPADDPFSLTIGYVAYWTENNQEIIKSFHIRLSNVRNDMAAKYITSTKQRGKLTNKKAIKKLLNLIDKNNK